MLSGGHPEVDAQELVRRSTNHRREANTASELGPRHTRALPTSFHPVGRHPDCSRSLKVFIRALQVAEDKFDSGVTAVNLSLTFSPAVALPERNAAHLQLWSERCCSDRRCCRFRHPHLSAWLPGQPHFSDCSFLVTRRELSTPNNLQGAPVRHRPSCPRRCAAP